jgi:hypothetical protein
MAKCDGSAALPITFEVTLNYSAYSLDGQNHLTPDRAHLLNECMYPESIPRKLKGTLSQ